MCRTQNIPQCELVNVLHGEGPRITVDSAEDGIDGESCNTSPSAHGNHIHVLHLSAVHKAENPEDIAQKDEDEGGIVFTKDALTNL